MVDERAIARSRLGRRVHWTAHVVLWLFLAAVWLPAVLPTTTGSPVGSAAHVFAASCALLFLFYIAYHYTALGNALARRLCAGRTDGTLRASTPVHRLPPVAILMTIRDDFSETAATTMLGSDYPRYRLYLCDDSETPATRDRVDRFAKTAPQVVKVIRRDHPTGFKAGNLNHALRSGAIDEPLLLIADSDERLGSTQLRALVEELQRWKSAFVQASHRSVRDEGSSFQRMLAPSVSMCWRVYEQPRNRYGVPLFLGHGVVVSTALVEAVGGFSELTTSEDIDFTYRLAFGRHRTHRGRTSEETFAEEEIPSSMPRYRRRFQRWMRQDLRYLPTATAQLWHGRRRVSPLEALDLLTKQIHIPACGLGQPYLFSLVLLLAVGDYEDRQSPWALGCVGVFAAVAPVLAVLLLGEGSVGHRAKAAVGSLWLFNGLVISGSRALLTPGDPSGRGEFVPTGTDASGEGSSGQAVATLALGVLAAGVGWLLLAAMSLAALGADARRRRVRIGVNSGALIALVAGLAQLAWNPAYCLALLPVGASRY